jgi:hypothetical protein
MEARHLISPVPFPAEIETSAKSMMTQCPENILLAKDTAFGIHRINHYVITVKYSAVFILCYIFELKNKLGNK